MKLSIIIPFRNREKHLEILLTSIVDKIKEEFDIVVVEQFNSKPFNKAKLLNIGFDYKKNDSDYFCFHDVDMIPQEDVDYSCTEDAIVHLSSRISQFSYKLPSENYCGGVISFKKNDFVQINGFSNEYWGWGGEDDDLYFRIKKSKLPFIRKNCTFDSLLHNREINQEDYQKNYNRLHSHYDYQKDGLSNLSYSMISKENINSFTEKIKVDF